LLQAKGAFVLYVDLWADPQADPAQVLATVIREALAPFGPALKRLAKSVGITGGKVGGVEMSLDKIGLASGVTLSQALDALSQACEKIIVLVIDEAQHTATTEAGSQAMFALKAARDHLNAPGARGLRIICTGSSQSKLAMLRSSKSQAFYGARLVAFPPLDKAYVQWLIGTTHAPLSGLDVSKTWGVFQLCGYRPEFLVSAIDDLALDFDVSESNVDVKFHEHVGAALALAEKEQLKVVRALTPLQLTVLCVLVSQGDVYSPFDEATLGLYRKGVSEKVNVDIPAVQQALIALKAKGLIWHESRGVYLLEDAGTANLLAQHGMLTPWLTGS
jgi:hypothetical protein